MMRHFRILPNLALCFAAFTVGANACVCDTTPSVADALKEASAIFVGRYSGSEYRKGIKNGFMEMRRGWEGAKVQEYEVLVYKFEVKTWWKGQGTREVILMSDHTRSSDGSETISDCGLGFEAGRDYLIYAYGAGDDFGTGACTRTKSLKPARADIIQLDRLARRTRPAKP